MARGRTIRACNMDTARVCHPFRELLACLGFCFSFSVEPEMGAGALFFGSRLMYLALSCDRTRGDSTYWMAFHRQKDRMTVDK